MGKVVVEKKRKKKGRPSLLDLQKRSIKEEQQQQQKHKQQQHQQNHHQQQQLKKSQSQLPTRLHRFQNPNLNPTATHLRRSTRRNPNLDSTPTGSDAAEDGDAEEAEEEEDEQEENDQLSGKLREKKLNLVLKSYVSVNSGSDSNAEDGKTGGSNHRKRKVDAIGEGSGHVKDENHDPAANAHQGVQFDDGPSTALPDKKLLLFVLDRLQKKDTYGVFADPVDPEELPDYHEVIKHPMDFSTVRKKLDRGSYANLEQFEKDIFLICSNAMQYNAPETIYFRQARSIQELAMKNFENLRQDSDENEPEPKSVRRGRPPTKNLKKPVGRPPLERATTEHSGATLATGGDNASRPNHDVRKGTPLEKFASADSLIHSSIGFRQPDSSISRSVERYERNEEITGSPLKGILLKHGKKQIVLEDNRRNTYTQPCVPVGGPESSVLAAFDGERKILIPVGLQAEYGYVRSLARFAAKLGPVAWKVASKKIIRCLPNGVKFGPGWIGENEAAALRPMLPLSSTVGSSQLLPQRPGTGSGTGTGSSSSGPKQAAVGSSSAAHMSPKRVDDTGWSEKNSPSSSIPQLDSSNPSKPPAASVADDDIGGLRPGANSLTSNVGVIRPGSPFQIHQNSLLRPHMNGISGTFGFNMGKQPQVGVSRPTTGPSIEAPRTEQQGTTSKIENNHTAAEKNNGSSNSCSPNSLQPLAKVGSAPPDLNVGFQSPGSPGGSGRVQKMQPDLALQL
ncbi:hypothetical protein Dimus_025905 [Dionaea muscipula]